MNKINSFLKNNNIKPLRYLKKGNVYILEENNNKFVLKKNIQNDLLYEYLNSRSFNYFPKIIKEDNDYILMEYIQDLDIPQEQKIVYYTIKQLFIKKQLKMILNKYMKI